MRNGLWKFKDCLDDLRNTGGELQVKGVYGESKRNILIEDQKADIERTVLIMAKSFYGNGERLKMAETTGKRQFDHEGDRDGTDSRLRSYGKLETDVEVEEVLIIFLVGLGLKARPSIKRRNFLLNDKIIPLDHSAILGLPTMQYSQNEKNILECTVL